MTLTEMQDALDSAISNVTSAQIDTDERHLNLTKAYSDAARVPLLMPLTGLRLITSNTTDTVTQEY